jgi:hypothetical protein
MDKHVHIEKSYYTTPDVDKINDYVKEINNIPYFKDFFDEFDSEDMEPRVSYSLTYHNDYNLYTEIIEKLICDIIGVSKKYNTYFNITLKIFDDGEFMTYWIVKDNIIHDLTSTINNFMTAQEALIL